MAYLVAHALFSLEGYCAAALSLRYEAVMLVWVSLIFVSNGVEINQSTFTPSSRRAYLGTSASVAWKLHSNEQTQ